MNQLAKLVSVAALMAVMVVVANAQGRGARPDGVWEGTGYQVDSQTTWTMRLTVRRGSYAIEYPSLNCGGRWRSLGTSGGRRRFREVITFGLSECTDRGTVTLERLRSGQLLFLYQDPAKREFNAAAILSRKKRSASTATQ